MRGASGVRSIKIALEFISNLHSRLQLTFQLADVEDRAEGLGKQKKKLEAEKENLKQNVSDLEMTIKKQESERASRDHAIRNLQDEIAAQDEAITRANKERKAQEEITHRLQADLAAEQDKLGQVSVAKLRRLSRTQSSVSRLCRRLLQTIIFTQFFCYKTQRLLINENVC